MAGSPTCLTVIYILWQLTEHLSKPKVTMGLQSNKNGTCVTNLTCCMEHGEEDVIYTWKALGQAANESHNGPILPISWRWGESDTAFICVARNPVSSNFSSPILARKLCEESIEEKKRADICRETPNICPHSGENTEYDTIPHTNRTILKEDPANTVYSTVEIPKKMENPHSLLTMPDTPRPFAYENVI
ncbi:SLAM family member 7 isoform X8 [Symphalangus syndactylus]|uniref:SLAM family member 7 isoform X8 n=1 Tax=Symphalangus syndactylus TaxID=9590 RepID=UPI0030076332